MMKNMILLLMAVCSLGVYSQKKKPVKGKTTTAVVSSKKLVLAKVGEVSAEQLEKKNGVLFFAMAGKDTLFSKPLNAVAGVASDAKITPFSAGSAKLHSISWNQQRKVGDAKTKLEEITESHTEIWDTAAKKRLFENTNLVNHITEIIWLDPNKTASKTEQKIRREGMECSVSAQGEVVLKNKASESKFAYDAAQGKFVAKK
jgi:hypothetical protein